MIKNLDAVYETQASREFLPLQLQAFFFSDELAVLVGAQC